MRANKALVAGLLVAATLSIFGLTTTGGQQSSNKNAVVLSKSNTVVLSGEIDGANAAQVISQARSLSSKRGQRGNPIYLFLNTPGGSIQTGLEMIEALQGLQRPISTISLFSASMGFQLVQGLGDRFVLKNGILMSHRAAGEFSGYFGGQRPSQMDSRYSFWLSRIQELDEQTVKRTNGKQTLQSYQKAYADEMWLTGAQAVEQGYADQIVIVSCDSSLDGSTQHSLDFLGLKITYELDNCPINTSPMNIKIAAPDEKTSVTYERSQEVKAKFMEQFINKQRAVVPTYW